MVQRAVTGEFVGARDGVRKGPFPASSGQVAAWVDAGVPAQVPGQALAVNVHE